MSYEQSLARYNEFIGSKEQYYIEYIKMSVDQKKKLKENIYKTLTRKHADDVWEWLND